LGKSLVGETLFDLLRPFEFCLLCPHLSSRTGADKTSGEERRSSYLETSTDTTSRSETSTASRSCAKPTSGGETSTTSSKPATSSADRLCGG
jgi:hypothetical protein